MGAVTAGLEKGEGAGETGKSRLKVEQEEEAWSLSVAEGSLGTEWREGLDCNCLCEELDVETSDRAWA
jgi:hypothetical protein